MSFVSVFTCAWIAVSSMPLRGPQTVVTSRSNDLQQLSLDDLISRLPPVNSAGHYDVEEDRYVMDPAPAELRWRLERGARLTDSQWQRTIELTQAIHLRPKWPVDLPVAVFMQAPAWLGLAEVRATPLDPSLAPLHAGSVHGGSVCGNDMISRDQDEQYQELGTFAPGMHRIPFDVEIRIGESDQVRWNEALKIQGPPQPSLPVGLFWRGRVELTFDIVASIDEVLAPRSDASLDGLIRDSLCSSFFRREPPDSGWLARIDTTIDAENASRILDTAVSLDLEVWHNGVMLENEARLVEPIFGIRPSRYPGAAWFTQCWLLRSVVVPPPHDSGACAGYSVRIHGSSKDVLHVWDATSRWDGEIWIQLPDVKVCRDP